MEDKFRTLIVSPKFTKKMLKVRTKFFQHSAPKRPKRSLFYSFLALQKSLTNSWIWFIVWSRFESRVNLTCTVNVICACILTTCIWASFMRLFSVFSASFDSLLESSGTPALAAFSRMSDKIIFIEIEFFGHYYLRQRQLPNHFWEQGMLK